MPPRQAGGRVGGTAARTRPSRCPRRTAAACRSTRRARRWTARRSCTTRPPTATTARWASRWRRAQDKPYDRHGTRGTYRVYQSPGCGGCPLAAACLGKTAKVRRVCRDEYEELRERMAARMDSEAGRAAYRRRGPVAEGAFATLKAVMDVRQYLLRGLAKVRIETDWAVTALNLTKLIRLTAR